MIKVRKSEDRGHFDHGWLDTYHTFSFAAYEDPEYMGFRNLRVINEDRVAPGEGFGTHSHQDMEIISYVIEGNLAHKDSMGNGSEIPAGDFQYMSAGSGVTHSEFNHEEKDKTHILQIWILPNAKDLNPRYDQVHVKKEEKKDTLKLIVSDENGDGRIKIRQDVKIFNAILEPGQDMSYELSKGRHAWVQVIKGGLKVNGEALNAGDGAAVSEEMNLNLVATGKETEFLLFDLN